MILIRWNTLAVGRSNARQLPASSTSKLICGNNNATSSPKSFGFPYNSAFSLGTCQRCKDSNSSRTLPFSSWAQSRTRDGSPIAIASESLSRLINEIVRPVSLRLSLNMPRLSKNSSLDSSRYVFGLGASRIRTSNRSNHVECR